MNDNAQKAAPSAIVHPPVKRPVDPRAVAVALAAIRADSERHPETYLRATVVPHGGE